MRVATWNIRHAASRNRTAVTAQLEHHRIDVCLLQEADGHHRWARDRHFHQPHIGPNRRWATGIASRVGQLTGIDEVQIGKHRFPLAGPVLGALAVAELATGSGPVTLVSLHNVSPTSSEYDIALVRYLADLAPLLARNPKKRLILGGDFNAGASTLARYDRIYRGLWQMLDSYDLIDVTEHTAPNRSPATQCPCVRAPGCGHLNVQQPRGHTPHGLQVDHLFVSRNLLSRVEDLEVLDAGPTPFALSDHRPLVMTLAV